MRIRTPKVATGFLKWMSSIQGFTVVGFSLFPWILINREQPRIKNNDYHKWNRIVNHESIHYYQNIDLTPVIFLTIYFGQYLINRIKYKDHHTAYRNIVYEREAYHNQNNLDYLPKERKWCDTFKYFNKKYKYIKA